MEVKIIVAAAATAAAAAAAPAARAECETMKGATVVLQKHGTATRRTVLLLAGKNPKKEWPRRWVEKKQMILVRIPPVEKNERRPMGTGI